MVTKFTIIYLIINFFYKKNKQIKDRVIAFDGTFINVSQNVATSIWKKEYTRLHLCSVIDVTNKVSLTLKLYKNYNEREHLLDN